MDENKVVIIFINIWIGTTVDLEIPLDISADELFHAVNSAYNLKAEENGHGAYLKCESPVALLKGNKKLKEYGIRNGSRIIY